MPKDRSSPREPQESPPSGGGQSRHTWTQAIANVMRVAGIVIGTAEGLGKGREWVMMFAAICVLGVDVVESILLRLIDRLFGGPRP